jgi:hypothetical protein
LEAYNTAANSSFAIGLQAEGQPAANNIQQQFSARRYKLSFSCYFNHHWSNRLLHRLTKYRSPAHRKADGRCASCSAEFKNKLFNEVDINTNAFLLCYS